MAHVTIDQARSGMILAAEVTDRRGRLLMPAGRELTDKHLAAFRMWGVAGMEVCGDEPEPAVPVFDEATLAQAEEVVRELFSLVGFDHPFLRELEAIARSRAARDLVRGPRGTP
jgi:hypothetical protein